MMKNRNALIYGATGGIGSALCRELNARDYKCYLIGRSPEKLGYLRKQLQISPQQVFSVPSITSDEGINQLSRWLKGLDIKFSTAVHSAGYGILKRASEISLSEWQAVMDINLHSAFSFFKLAWELKDPEQFEVVFFGSASADQVWPKNSLYGASKAGLEMFAKSLQKEIQPEGGRVWFYKPASVDTAFFDQLPKHIPREKMIDPVTLAKLVVDNLGMDSRLYLPEIPVYSEERRPVK